MCDVLASQDCRAFCYINLMFLTAHENALHAANAPPLDMLAAHAPALDSLDALVPPCDPAALGFAALRSEPRG